MSIENRKKFFKKVLEQIGIPDNNNAFDFLMMWSNHEISKATNNPLNTSYDMKNPLIQSKFNSHGVKNYISEDVGVTATAKTLKLGYYKNLLRALINNVTIQEMYKLPNISKELQTWGTFTVAAKFDDQKKKRVADNNKPKGTIISTVIGILFMIGLYYYFTLKNG
jgi:hypothetical protein